MFRGDMSMVDRQIIELGTVLRQFPSFEFSMEGFNARLRLQKFIYLLQSFDVFLGYNYNWYIRGPYCSTLATCGFGLQDVYDQIPEGAVMEFADPTIQGRFSRFRKFIQGRETNTDWLEIAASIHMLNRLDYDRDCVIQQVVAKQARFTREQVEREWAELERWELLTT